MVFRCSFSDIQRDIENLMKSNGLKTNMLDNMVEMMEKYTGNLESIVRDRTSRWYMVCTIKPEASFVLITFILTLINLTN